MNVCHHRVSRHVVLHHEKSVVSPVLRCGSLILAALVLLSAFPVTAYANPTAAAGLPQIDPTDPHRLLLDGQPWYPVGYYPNIASLNGDQTDYEQFYKTLIDSLAANRINLLRNVLNMGQPYGDAMTLYERTGPGTAADGKPRFDLTRFTPGYFDYWRKVIEYARSKGVVVQLVITDSWHNKSMVTDDNGDKAWGMRYDYYHPNNNINQVDAGTPEKWHSTSNPSFEYHRALIREVVNQLGDLPNIIYEISNENYVSKDWELQLANYLSDYESSQGKPRHLVMPRDLPNHDGAGGKQMDPARTHNELVDRWGKNQPLIADNDGGGDANPDIRRRKAWAALTAGGHMSYFHGGMHRMDVLNSQDAQNGMFYLGLTQKFLADLNVNLSGMKPKDNLVSNGWALAQPESRYIVYLTNGGSTKVSRMPATYQAWWFNPRDGSSQPASGGPTFKAPDGKDWVLYISGSGGSAVVGLDNHLYLPTVLSK